MRDWSNDPRLAEKQRLRELGPIIQAHADTNGIPPDGPTDVDCALAELTNVYMFMKFPPTPEEITKALDEQRGILIRHPDTDQELGTISYEELLELRNILAEGYRAR